MGSPAFAALTRLDIGVMIPHEYGAVRRRMATMLTVAQLPIPLIVVGKMMPHRTRRRRFLRTLLFLLRGSGTSTVAGTRALFANPITLAGFALRTTSFIVAMITDTTWNVT